METSILNEFLVLEEQHSFSKAAKQLSISQATLSRHIKLLEDEYGVTLVERTTQKMSLTPYGEALVVYARTVIESGNQYKKNLERLKYKASSHLTIGTIDFPYYYGITSLFASFKKDHNHAILEVHVGSTDDLLKMLVSGKIDVAFIRNITDLTKDYTAFLYRKDYLTLVVPANHPMAQEDRVKLTDFSKETFYSRSSKGSLMDQFETEAIRGEGFEPIRSINHGTWEDSVINGGSDISLVSQGLAQTLAGNVHLKVLKLNEEIHADIWCATLKNAEQSDIATTFVNYVKERTFYS